MNKTGPICPVCGHPSNMQTVDEQGRVHSWHGPNQGTQIYCVTKEGNAKEVAA